MWKKRANFFPQVWKEIWRKISWKLLKNQILVVFKRVFFTGGNNHTSSCTHGFHVHGSTFFIWWSQIVCYLFTLQLSMWLIYWTPSCLWKALIMNSIKEMWIMDPVHGLQGLRESMAEDLMDLVFSVIWG